MVFKGLDRGVKPTETVVKHGLDPSTVMEIVKRYNELMGLSFKEPVVAGRLKKVERRVARQGKIVGELELLFGAMRGMGQERRRQCRHYHKTLRVCTEIPYSREVVEYLASVYDLQWQPTYDYSEGEERYFVTPHPVHCSVCTRFSF